MELERLTTEARNPASEQIDRLTPLEMVRLMNAEDATVAAAVRQVAEPIAAAIQVIADRLRAGGRLIYVGAGTSGRLGVLDASECPPTFNTRPGQVIGLIAGGLDALTRPIEGAEDSPDAAVRDLQRIDFCNRDVLVGIAASGRTPYVLGALEHANQIGAYTIGLSCNADSVSSPLCRLAILPVVGPEIISGSTRLKAGTATKMVLNMLSTGAMVLLGKTYGNLMVDLQATNQKLADRSRRIVMALTGLPGDQADECLKSAGGDVKRAAVVALRGVSPMVARELLQAAKGQLRGALELPVEAAALATATLDAPNEPRRQTDGELLLAIDGGGTKTVACLAWAGAAEPIELARGLAGPSNAQVVGWETARTNIEQAVERAFQAANLPRRIAATACLAIAGAGRPDDRQRLQQWAEHVRLAERVIVTHDALAVLAAASPDNVGIALTSGTGSIAFGRNRRDETARAGGWGHLIGDEGSGWFIARQALCAVARALDDRGPPTGLTAALFQTLDAETPPRFLQKVYQFQEDRVHLAQLAPLVEAVAADGDAVAREILETAANELAELVRVMTVRLPLEREDRILALSGGTLIRGSILRTNLLRQLERLPCPPSRIVLVPAPVLGALAIAHARLVHGETNATS